MRLRPQHRWTLVAPVLAVTVLALLPSPVWARGASPSNGPSTAMPELAASTVLARTTVTWNGHNISSAGSPSSAFAIGKGQSAFVYFSFDEVSGPAIPNASVKVTYLGLVLTTSTAAVGPAPTTCLGCSEAEINWTFGTLVNALQGVYQLTASLQYADGSTAWSESFYVIVRAPYSIESGAVVILLVLAFAEVYWGLTAIAEARQGRKPPAIAPATSPAPTSPTGGGAPPPEGPGPVAPAGPSGSPPAAPGSGGGGPA